MKHKKVFFLICTALLSIHGFSQIKKQSTAEKTVVAAEPKTAVAEKKANPKDKIATADKKVEVTDGKIPTSKTVAPGDKKLADKTTIPVLDTLKIKTAEVNLDSMANLSLKFKSYKKTAHASYYHDKFNGKRTASGKKFDNKKYTAAHRKFPFGTKLKITNISNGKSVIVEVTDRGPFSRGREIDITRKAFMEIADNKNGGSMSVSIEVEDN